jgi:hypothetical protein
MTRTEEHLRDMYADLADRPPDASPVLARVLRGTERRRRRRRIETAVALGVAVVALVVPLAIWPRHTGPDNPSTAPNNRLAIGMDIAPRWLPADFVETERRYSPGGYRVDDNPDPVGPSVVRIFRTATAEITISDGALPVTVTTRPLTVNGQQGVGVGTKIGSAFRLQVPWHSGRLLDVFVRGMPGARAVAIRVAQSVRSAPAVTLDAPLTCTDPLCRPRASIEVHGLPDKWTATVFGQNANVVMAQGGPTIKPGSAVRHLTINGHSAIVWQGGMGGSSAILTVGAGRTVLIYSGSRRPLSLDEVVRVAKSVQLDTMSNYAWLGTRPG